MSDATRRPLQIPQKYIDYMDRYRVPYLFQRMYEELLTRLPADPLSFLVQHLSREVSSPEVPRVFVSGADPEQEMEVATEIAVMTEAVALSRHDVIYQVTEGDSGLKGALQEAGGVAPPELLARILGRRLLQEDCLRSGWVLTGVPQSRDELLSLQMGGVLPTHTVFLAEGKIDRPPAAGFRPASGAGAAAQEHASRLRQMLPACGPLTRVFPSGGPREEVLRFVLSRGRESAPLVLRVLLLGVPGSGRRTQAARIAAKHDLVDVHCGTALRAAMKARSPEGRALAEFLDRGATPPEELVMAALAARLSAADCRGRGWVLHGFPRDAPQAEQLVESELLPNRVVLLDVPAELAIARQTYRRFEPASGQVITLSDELVLPREVTHRLRRHPDDDPRRLAVVVEERQAALRGLVGLFESQLQVVDGTRSETEVAEAIEKITVFQTPKFF